MYGKAYLNFERMQDRILLVYEPGTDYCCGVGVSE